MVTLQEFKTKMLELLYDIFPTKTEVDEKENEINELLNQKININDNFNGDYDNLENKPLIPIMKVIHNEEEIEGNGIYLYKED